MRTYHAKSWSQQARELSDNLIYQVNKGWRAIDSVAYFWRCSYRHPRIIIRAAKRFGRMVRADKVHESPEARAAWKKECVTNYKFTSMTGFYR